MPTGRPAAEGREPSRPHQALRPHPQCLAGDNDLTGQPCPLEGSQGLEGLPLVSSFQEGLAAGGAGPQTKVTWVVVKG